VLSLRAGDHDDGQRGGRVGFADAAEYLAAVHVGHHAVQQDQVERLGGDELQRGQAALRLGVS
jgi:hypothetical protein